MDKMNKNFTRKTLDLILERIIDEYFQDDYQGGLWETIEYVKNLYEDEITSLDEC